MLLKNSDSFSIHYRLFTINIISLNMSHNRGINQFANNLEFLELPRDANSESLGF